MYHLTDDKFSLLLENNMRGGPSSCVGKRHVKRTERKLLYDDMKKLYGWSMSQQLPTTDFLGVEFTIRNERNLIKTILRTPDLSKSGFFLECDLEYPSNTTEKKTK